MLGRCLRGRDDSLQLQAEDILQASLLHWLDICEHHSLQEGWDIDEMADIMKAMRIHGQEAFRNFWKTLMASEAS